MPVKNKIFRVFVASPGDVKRERDSLLGVVNELNRTFDALIPEAGIRVELLRWETDASPDMGRPQEIINTQIQDYDIFIGIFSRRFGTPTGTADSGTAEEFEIAFNKRSANGKPRIMIYFNVASGPTPRSSEEIKQLGKVVEFRERLDKLGLTWDYEGDSLFPGAIRPHLIKAIGQLLRAEDTLITKGVAAVPVGTKVRLIEIGKEDACYDHRDKYLNRTGVLIEAEVEDGWLRGTVRFDTPLFEGDNGIYSFLQFHVNVLE